MWEQVSNPSTHIWMGTARACDGALTTQSSCGVPPGRKVLLHPPPFSTVFLPADQLQQQTMEMLPHRLWNPPAATSSMCPSHFSCAFKFPCSFQGSPVSHHSPKPKGINFLQVAQTQRGWEAAECGTAVTFLWSLCLSSHPSGHQLPVQLPSPVLKEMACSHSHRLLCWRKATWGG